MTSYHNDVIIISMPNTIVSISLSKDLAVRLQQAVEETDRQRSWLVARALEEYLEEMEDLEIARERLHHPHEKRLTEKALRKKLGL